MQTVNLNGTDRRDLAMQWLAVREAAEALQKALQASYPHGRDFPNGGLIHAQESHREIMRLVGEAYNYACDNQINIGRQ